MLPEAQLWPEWEQHWVLPWKGGTPAPSGPAHRWKWDLNRSQGEEAVGNARNAKQINK